MLKPILQIFSWMHHSGSAIVISCWDIKPPCLICQARQRSQHEFRLAVASQLMKVTTTGTDIIAIHGTNGHAHYTWTVDGNDGLLWLRDFLPREIPGSRVYSFGYDSRALFSKTNWDLTSFSRSFLAQLVAARRGQLRHRSLVFLCHSMGGLVLKQVRL